MFSSSSLFRFIALIGLIAIEAVLAAPSAPSASTVKTQALAAHNNYRTSHHVPELKWSNKLAEHAKNVSSSCVYQLNRMEGTGQNIAYGYSSMKAAIDAWYKQSAYYKYGESQPSDGKSTNSFTQVVWKGTTEVGCAATYCPNLRDSIFYVCDYSPPGNIRGKYAENVFQP
ncbi:CAP domain-containing protein [Mucor lusitanicus]|uniref:SCP domain-containing protein n=2 Tax=Mucor circinelloides f. lusitanicus TaxID=29924 RepID=A0A168PGS6_MUCCL|nr:CAP domain-containing protein [Mucor lusitanicus]OAD07713.1 hypothetical protein MUCCIDRAFT_104655 [Mucor lusitanicus CBS 277.49]